MHHRSKPHPHLRHSLPPIAFTLTVTLMITTTHLPSAVTALPLRKTIDWAVHGIGAEVFHNAVVRPLSSVFGSNHHNHNHHVQNTPIHTPSSEPTTTTTTMTEERSIAIVTGATGGIGTELCHGLLSRNYHVLVLARNVSRGNQLVEALGPHASFVEYHADRADGTGADDDDDGDWIRAVVGTKPVAVLINNAGVVGGTKKDTMDVNLVAPTVLTLSLLKSLKRYARLDREGGDVPVVVNVGSSSHLRTGNVDPNNLHLNDTDSNLASYAESKLGLMQFSNVLRSAFPWLTVVDAHPGLVWTPLLRNNFPGARFLDWIGLSRVLSKSPESGASTILAAVDEGRRLGLLHSGKNGQTVPQQKQVYVVNRKVGGYSSKESQDVVGSITFWNNVLGPAVRGLVPGGYDQVQKNIVSGGDIGSGKSTCSSADVN